MLKRKDKTLETLMCRNSELVHQVELLEELRCSQRSTINNLKDINTNLQTLLDQCKADMFEIINGDTNYCHYCKHYPGDSTTAVCKHECDRFEPTGFEWRGLKED